MKIIKTSFFIFMIMLASPVCAQLTSGEMLTFNEKVDHDLYTAGNTVTINAPVHGDFIAASGTLIVNDTIYGDILIAGGNVVINGYVADDIRGAGGSIKINSTVVGDVIITGGKLTIDKTALIKGYLIMGGSDVVVDGEVQGNIKSASHNFTLNGKADSELDARGGKVVVNGNVNKLATLAAPTIEIGPSAQFKNNVQYWNTEGSLDFKKSIQGKATYDPTLEMEGGKWHYLGFATFLMALWYLGTALVMLLIIEYLFGSLFKNAADTIKNSSLKSLGLGFLLVIGIPVSIVIAVLTVIGLPVGILLLIGYITLLIMASVIVALLISHWISNTYYQSSWSKVRLVLIGLMIFIFLKAASLTPFVGPLIMALLGCMAFGGLLLTINWKRNKAEG